MRITEPPGGRLEVEHRRGRRINRCPRIGRCGVVDPDLVIDRAAEIDVTRVRTVMDEVGFAG